MKMTSNCVYIDTYFNAPMNLFRRAGFANFNYRFRGGIILLGKSKVELN